MFARLPLEVLPLTKCEVKFGNCPSITLCMHGVTNDALRQCLLAPSSCSRTKRLLNRDVIELHLTSCQWYPASATQAADHLLQWLTILNMPWATGKTTKAVHRRLTALMREFYRLMKNQNARVNRGGNMKASHCLSTFLYTPFDKKKAVSSGKITHDMEYHTKALHNLCCICGKKLMKAKEANRYECQPLIVGEHREEIDAVWDINVWKDTSNCPSKLCHRCGRSIRYVKSGTRTFGRRTKHPNMDWEALQHEGNGLYDICSNYKMFQRGSGGSVKWPSRTLQVTKPSPTPLPYSLLADDIFAEQVSQLPHHAILDVPHHAILDVPPISIQLTQRTELKSLYTCLFCLCIVTKPVALPCHHNFCSQCLTKYFQFHKSCSVSCPVCSLIFSFQEVRCSPLYITMSLPHLPVECSSCGANKELHKLVDHKCVPKQHIVNPSCENTSASTNLSCNNEQSTYHAVTSGRQQLIKYINPLRCKYCKRTFHDGLRYRIHVHRHERRIKPYWYRRKLIPVTQALESVTFVLVNQWL